MLLTNQIIVFSGYWYLWKESCDILVFFMGSIIKQRKHLELLDLSFMQSDFMILWSSWEGVSLYLSENSTLGWVWSVKLLVKWDYRIFWSWISLGKIKWYLTSFHGVIRWSQSSMEGSTWHYYFWLALTGSNWISRFFDPGGNKFIPLHGHYHLYLLLSNFIKFCRGPFNYIFLIVSYIYFASYFLRLP